MDWYADLYTDRITGTVKERLIAEIEDQKYRGNTYLITLAANPENQLDIFSVQELRFPYLRRNCSLIVGLASCRESALLLTERIVQDVYESTKDVKIRDFFLLKR
ncbi:MAG: hypothetical protein Q4E91_10470 [Lachnospiraceae bacterium]|nr:hypothetical protein [Lachnospiraceae bacterium]